MSTNFAHEQSLGKIPYRKSEAKGPVFVGDGAPLTLDVGGGDHTVTLMVPSLFEKIDRGEFCELILKEPVQDSVLNDPKQRQLQTENLAKILRTAADWSNLKSVALNYCVADKAAIRALNDMKHLCKLALSSTEIDSAELARQPLIGRLQCVVLLNVLADDIVRKLSGSPNLTWLVLERTSISPAALASLSRCPNLKYLQLNATLADGTIDDRIIEALAQLKSVINLTLKGNTSPEQIKMLLRSPGFKQIHPSKESLARLRALNIHDSRISSSCD